MKTNNEVKELQLRLLSAYTNDIRERLYESGLPFDATMTHIDKSFIEFEKKIRYQG